ncbi:MAG: dihydroorotase [Bryobacterales bacterium]|nr:dihydroorotase [Bryobacterales bacterium]
MPNDLVPYELIIEGGEVFTPNGIQPLDIGIRGGRVEALGALGSTSAAERLDASGLLVLPGVIDTQVHFREPGLEHKEDLESGTRSAILGGVTAIFEMPNTKPATTSPEALADKLSRAKGRAWCDYAFFIGASAENASQLGEWERLPGCAGVKIFMGSSTGDLLVESDADLANVLRHGVRRVSVHAEDEPRMRERKALAEEGAHPRFHPIWRDEVSAVVATQRLLSLAEKAGRRVHVLHITTKQEIELLAAWKHLATVELTPQHLSFDAPDCYDRLGTLAQMNPPIRAKEHQDALWAGLLDGTVDVLGSDHAPHTLDEKSKPYPQSPSGMTGVQTLLPVMLTHVLNGRLTLERLVDLTSAGPSRIFGIARKGRIARGYDADFAIVDLKRTEVLKREWIASKCGWSPYEGRLMKGWPVHTVLRGHIAVRDGELQGRPQGGEVGFVETQARSS